MEYVAAVAGFGLVGYWIDAKWDSGPWGVLIGAALGLTGATYNLVRQSIRAFDEQKREAEGKRKPKADEGPSNHAQD